MQPYKNTGGSSGVSAFEIGPNFIRVQFKTGAVYLYTNASAGSGNISEMKSLAIDGQGLNTFINKVVRKNFERKER